MRYATLFISYLRCYHVPECVLQIHCLFLFAFIFERNVFHSLLVEYLIKSRKYFLDLNPSKIVIILQLRPLKEIISKRIGIW